MSILVTNNYIIERIERILEDKKISRYRLALNSGIPQSSITNLLNRKNVPTIATLEKICKGMDMTLSQFFAYDDECLNLSPRQKEVLDIWNSLPDDKKDLAIAYLSGLAQSSR